MRFQKLVAAAVVLTATFSAFGSGPALLLVERRSPQDRTILLTAGVPVVREFERGFLAAGDPEDIGERTRSVGYGAAVVAPDTSGWVYYTAALKGPGLPGAAGGCGEVVWAEQDWVLLRSATEVSEACAVAGLASLRRLGLEPLRLPLPPPDQFSPLQGEAPPMVTPDPMVPMILGEVSGEEVLAVWDGVIASARTRYTRSDGCRTAGEFVLHQFGTLGLGSAFQAWDQNSAPNVIGTIVGKTNPEKVVIAIAHLDDMPSFGPAPGADDNASGVAMVLAAAKAMAPYSFGATVKFLAVTGEEQGLLGAGYYANDAYARGEQILAVLNADMIGWEGDTPGSENLDLNYIDGSRWLGELFAQCATEYGTGCAVDAFDCLIGASDHAPFWDLGYSAVCGITDNEGYCGHMGSYKYYHTSGDTREHCGDPAFFLGAVKAYVATLAHLAGPLCRSADAPAGLEASPEGENRVRLTWSPVDDGFTTEVYRSRDGCGSASFAKLGQTEGTSFLDATACGDRTYAYRVVARDPAGLCSSPPSSCVSVRGIGHCLEVPADPASRLPGLEGIE